VSSFDQWVGKTINIEGGLSLKHSDRGNWTGGKLGVGELKGTKYGISAMSYPNEDIANLTPERAKEIYKANFWDRCRCDDMPFRLDFLVFDAAVNHGPGNSGKMLQRTLNGIIGNKLVVDGGVGPKTIAALQDALGLCTTGRICASLLLERMDFYADLLNGDPRHDHDYEYIKGWLNRLTALRKLVGL